MAVPTARTGVIRNVKLTISTYDFEATIRKARLVPETNKTVYRTCVPEGVVVDVDNPAWTLELEGMQDHAEALGLCRLLTDHHGEELDCVLAPRNEDGYREATFTVMAEAVPFGDEEGAFASFEAALGLVGQPVWDDIEMAP